MASCSSLPRGHDVIRHVSTAIAELKECRDKSSEFVANQLQRYIHSLNKFIESFETGAVLMLDLSLWAWPMSFELEGLIRDKEIVERITFHLGWASFLFRQM